MAQIVPATLPQTPEPSTSKPCKKKVVIVAPEERQRRRRERIKASIKLAGSQPNVASTQIDSIREMSRQLALMNERMSTLTLDHHGKPTSTKEKAHAKDSVVAVVNPTLSDEKPAVPMPRCPIVEPQERDVCNRLFAPMKHIPEPTNLYKELLRKLEVKIPIHHYIYHFLENNGVERRLLEDNFAIVEEVGNICPKLTPRIETALLSDRASVGTESMQQHVLDSFLMGIIGTAQDYLSLKLDVNRNASESSMTLPKQRPDYILTINNQLVFKGEEKRSGDVREIAKELLVKMKRDIIGSEKRQRYLLGYASASSNVLFECIHENSKMTECAEVINLLKVSDRARMVLILVNIVRIVHAQMLKWYI